MPKAALDRPRPLRHLRGMIPEDRLDDILRRFEYLEARMAETVDGDEIARLSREYAHLKPVVNAIAEWRAARSFTYDTARRMRLDAVGQRVPAHP